MHCALVSSPRAVESSTTPLPRKSTNVTGIVIVTNRGRSHQDRKVTQRGMWPAVVNTLSSQVLSLDPTPMRERKRKDSQGYTEKP